jgi:membrane-bound serine protease (ClpP class)
MPLNTKTPVYACVPPGAKAASAGAFIAMAADKIYMVPTAQIGASEPCPSDLKVVNYAAAHMRSPAETKWNDTRVEAALSLITKNRVLTGREAVELGILEARDGIPIMWAQRRLDELLQMARPQSRSFSAPLALSAAPNIYQPQQHPSALIGRCPAARPPSI